MTTGVTPRVAADRDGQPVRVGTHVRVLTISPSLRERLSEREWRELNEMVGEVFTVKEIDEWGQAWVEKWWYPADAESFSHSLGLDSQEMHVVEISEA
jgi:hypothetical protein